MKRKNRFAPSLEMLEDRLTPSLTIMTDLAGNLSVTGTPDFSAGTQSQPVTITETSANTWQIVEGAATLATVFAPGNVNINFSQSALDDNVTVNLGGNTLGGNLTVNTGGGADSFSFAGGGSVGGSVSLTGPINVTNSTAAAAVNVGGNFTIQNGSKHLANTITLDNHTIGGNLSISTGNAADTVTIGANETVGGSLTASLGGGNNQLSTVATDSIGGSFTYLGGSGNDIVAPLDGTIGRNVYANLGSGGTNTFTQAATATFGGNLTVIAGLGTNTVNLNGLTAGSAYFNLGSTGATAATGNTWNFNAGAAIDGGAITYIGGVGVDTDAFNGTTAGARANFNLGAGNDSFTLGAGTNLASLYIDFGPGTDTFTNNAGSTAPPMTLKNLP
jgi:hypothetical protein